MPDHAYSDHPGVQAQLDRLARLSPGRDILGLERITALLARLGDPQHRLPPVFHVAGTNGKGSTCAVLRAALEGDGKRVHAYTSPHLVRFNERIRLSGELIGDDALAHYLARVLDAANGLAASFFEVTTAAAFLAFADHPVDACIVEVGLGGRLDATNVIPSPAACGIARLGIDHEAFLGSDRAVIAREKAGIARPGRPLVTLDYPFELREAIADIAGDRGATLLRDGREWSHRPTEGGLRVVTSDRTIDAARPALAGMHQTENAALAIAMLAQQRVVAVGDAALAQAPARATWPARLQKLGPGPLRDLLGFDGELWLDGGHNPNAAEALAGFFADGERVDIVLGMLANKDAAAFIAALAPVARSLTGVPVPDHEHHPPERLEIAASVAGVARTASSPDLAAALAPLRGRRVAILGSLYLAGEALKLNREYPR